MLEKNRFVSNWFHRQPQARLAVFKGGRAGILQRLKWAPTVNYILKMESLFTSLDDESLRKHSLELQWRMKGGETAEQILPEAYALIREAAQRTIQLRHFAVQILGAIALHHRSIIEMQTGEGKTLVATMPAYLNALSGKGVHIVTVNDYLARRDAAWMGPVFHLLGLSVGCIQTPMQSSERKAAYACDITYGTAKEFGFDFLRDRLAGADSNTPVSIQPSSLFSTSGKHGTKTVQREPYYAIVDEADSVFIDEARTPLIISTTMMTARDKANIKAYEWSSQFVTSLDPTLHYTYNSEKKEASLTKEGRRAIRSTSTPQGMDAIPMESIYEFVERAIRADRGMLRDRDYMVDNDEVLIIDENTGRTMPGRKWRGGLHQAIEAKEQLPITPDTGTAARTTTQDYFLRYKKLAGMTGTAQSSSQEFHQIYKLKVVEIPTNRPLCRTQESDCIYPTEREKIDAVLEKIQLLYSRGQPVLVGTPSIEKSEHLSSMLEKVNIPHSVLNAKQHEQEADIIKMAGQPFSVTIATNMAGRGTDIRLGKDVEKLGGLFVLVTERHDSSRIDRQLVGRSGRQGDPGTGQFFISLDDDLVQALDPEKAVRLQRTYRGKKLQGIPYFRVRNFFDKCQKKREQDHFQQRHTLMKFEKQRRESQENMGLDPFLA